MTTSASKRVGIGALLLAALLLAAGGSATPAAAAPKEIEKPNVVIVMTDDQALEDMRAMPKARKMLGDKGITFANSFASNPICCPSRASFLTGQYAHTHGVFRNSVPNGGYYNLDDSETLPVWLNRAGYNTAHMGKYPNGYGQQDGPDPIPPGWTEWYGAEDPGTYRMYGYTLNENGENVTYGDYDIPDPASYQTDVLAQKATDFIARRAPEDAPFFLSVAPLAPHVEVFQRISDGDDDPPTPAFPNPRPAPRHYSALKRWKLDKTGSFNEADVSDKPEAIRNLPPLDGPATGQARNKHRSRLASLLSVDDLVSRVVNTLRANGELNRTIIIFTSDNGFLLGEHRIRTGKQFPYEPSIRVPLLMRGPGIAKGEVRDQLVANVDLAPTIADYADASTGVPPDGRSIRRLVRNPDLEPGRAIVIENWCQTNEPACFDPETPRYRGVRTNRYAYMEYPNGEREMYDLGRDPDQMRSLHAKPKFDDEEAALHELLARLQDCAAGACKAKPRLKLKISYKAGRLGSGKRCTDSPVTVRVKGRDAGTAAEAEFAIPGRDEADKRRPLRLRLGKRDLKGGRATPIAADVSVLDGRLVALKGKVPRAC